MSRVISYKDESNRIFLISALGSLLVHGIFIGMLPLSLRHQAVEKTPPRVLVQLVQQGQEQANPQSQQIPPPKQLMTLSSFPPPPPTPRSMISTPPPPAPNIVHRSQPVVPSPKTLTLKKPVLRDAQTSRALQARELTKMVSPSQPSLPNPPQRQEVHHTTSSISPPMPQPLQSFSQSPVLQPPPPKASQSLQALPPTATGGGITKPILLASSKPLYPRVAREAGWEGTVVVRTLIDMEGNPRETKISKSSGHPSLDQSAIEAIKMWKFQPAKDGNIPISKWVDIPVKFNLNQ